MANNRGPGLAHGVGQLVLADAVFRPWWYEFYKAWRIFSPTRAYKLKLNPECEDCLREAWIWPATEVHHILKIADRPERLDQENLMSLCHGKSTGRGESWQKNAI